MLLCLIIGWTNMYLGYNTSLDEIPSELRLLDSFSSESNKNPPIISTQLKRISSDKNTNSQKTSSPVREICISPEVSCEMVSDADTKARSREEEIKAKTKSKTLALADPVLFSGYRNQAFRLIALVMYAVRKGYDEILLPSLRWDGRPKSLNSQKHPVAIPFETLFDVEHWNRQTDLPRLVEYNASLHYDWDPSRGLFHGVDCEVVKTYLHRKDPEDRNAIMERIANVSANHPHGYGGGVRAGTLWNDYKLMIGNTPIAGRRWNVSLDVLQSTEESVVKALKPVPNILEGIKYVSRLSSSPYLAFHPRVEVDMIKHRFSCTSIRESNLTSLFHMIQSYDKFKKVDNMFVAINIDSMETTLRNKKSKYFALHEENKLIFKQATTLGLDRLDQDKNMALIFGGKEAIQKTNTPQCAHTIGAAILNFEIAVNADMFLGTKISSWSSSVWQARFLSGRGSENYMFTPNGIEKIEGRPEPFEC